MAEETSKSVLIEFMKRYQQLVEAAEWAQEGGLPSEARRERAEAAQRVARECMELLTRYLAAGRRELDRS